MCKKLARDIPGIDKECIDIIDKLNSLPKLRTYESCCGHGKEPLRICFECSSWSTLAILARSTDRNYSSGIFSVKVINCDSESCCNFILESAYPLNREFMKTQIEYLIKNIDYWSSPEFEKYFYHE